MQILGIPIWKYKYKNFFNEITLLKKKTIVFTPNPEIILNTIKDKEFKKILLKANYLVPDWTWLFIAYQIIDFKKKLKHKFFFILIFLVLPIFIFNVIFRKKYIYGKYWDKICGSDLSFDLLTFAEKNNIKISILDLYNPNDEKKVASQKAFSKKIKEKYKKLDFDYIIYDETKKEKIIEKISKNKSKIIFSTLGMKKQEKSIIDLMWKCNNLKLGLWVWSSFDYIVWFQKRAPKLWRVLWLEWLYRLISWPQKIKRLKRLWNAIFVFIYKVIIN